MAILRTGYTDQFFEDALPALEDVAMEEHDSYPSVISEIFNMETSDRWGEQYTEVTGLGLSPEVAENAPVSYDDIYQRFNKTFTHLYYALAVRYSKQMQMDEKWSMIQKLTRALGRSMAETCEIIHADHFNNAFTAGAFAGPDGKALCATDHPLYAGTEQNELTTPADLSVTSLKQATIDLKKTVDERGKKLNIRAMKLLVPDELEFTADELLKSTLLADTANNNTNSLQRLKLTPLCWSYLTAPKAWFLVSGKDQHSMVSIEREAANISSDYDFDTRSTKTRIDKGFSSGFYGWRGIFGSPGV